MGSKLAASKFRNKGIMEIADALDACGAIDDTFARTLYTKATGKKAPVRWAKVDVLVGTIAGTLEEDESS